MLVRSAGDLLTIRPYITAPSRVGTDFTIMTLSTVGFGDISPSPTGDMRTFVAFYALGSGIVFPLLAKLFGDLLTRYSEMVCILYPNPYPNSYPNPYPNPYPSPFPNPNPIT